METSFDKSMAPKRAAVAARDTGIPKMGEALLTFEMETYGLLMAVCDQPLDISGGKGTGIIVVKQGSRTFKVEVTQVAGQP